jgi:hypothetical protein
VKAMSWKSGSLTNGEEDTGLLMLVESVQEESVLAG